MAVQALDRLRISETSSSARALEMIQRARTPLWIAIALAVTVGVVVPVLLGLPSLTLVGGLFSASLMACLWSIGARPRMFLPAGHVACLLGSVAVAYAIFGFELPQEISVYLMAITLLAAAQFLGVRAAVIWGIVGVTLVAVVTIFPAAEERDVPIAITLVVRLAALVTVLIFAISIRQTQDQQSAHLEIRAATDSLTGLANRDEFDRKLAEALLRSRRFDRGGALLFVDLDGLKSINDSFGHAAGDELIQTTAARIAGATRNVDTPARLGGDEFVILLSECEHAGGAEVFGRRLLAILTEPVDLNGQSLTPSASIGVALFPEVGHEAEDVLRAADGAMYEAKRAGGGRVFLRDGTDLREVV